MPMKPIWLLTLPVTVALLAGCQPETVKLNSTPDEPPFPADRPLTEEEKARLLPAYEESSLRMAMRNASSEHTIDYLQALNYETMASDAYRRVLKDQLEFFAGKNLSSYNSGCPDNGYRFSTFNSSPTSFSGHYGHYQCIDFYKEWKFIPWSFKRVEVGEQMNTGAYRVQGDLDPVNTDYGLPSGATIRQQLAQSDILYGDLSNTGIEGMQAIQDAVDAGDIQMQVVIETDVKASNNSFRGNFSMWSAATFETRFVLKEDVILSDDSAVEDTVIPYLEVTVNDIRIKGTSQSFDQGKSNNPRGGKTDFELMQPLKLRGDIDTENKTISLGSPSEGTLRLFGTTGYMDLHFDGQWAWLGGTRTENELTNFGIGTVDY